MARTPRKLNNASSEVIEKNILAQDPEGFQTTAEMLEKSSVVVAKEVPAMRRVQFINQRDPGQELMFHYHSKTHPLKHYTLYHGKEYDLPVEIIEHLENCAEKQYGYRVGPSGHPEMYTKGLKYIFSCKSPRKVA